MSFKEWWKRMKGWQKGGIISLFILFLLELFFMIKIGNMPPETIALFGNFAYPVAFILLFISLGVIFFSVGAIIGGIIEFNNKRKKLE